MEKPTKEQYLTAKREILRIYAPDVRPCNSCGWPYISGYCCTSCGSPTPFVTTQQPKDAE